MTATLALGGGTAASAATSIQCQHPVSTGVVVFNLRHVLRTTACHTALALYRWYNGNGGYNASDLYSCVGTQPHAYPVLKRHRFDGWALSSPGARNLENFEMSRGNSSFYVTGTDFPLNCS